MKKKTAIITARLTPAEKAAIERRAKQANMTITDYIVKSALGKNVRQADDLAPILSELKVQGRNLNQLTKLANMGRITLVDAENFTGAYTNLILSRLVDTFISKISLTMLPVPKPHNTACVLSWEEARHWQSRSSGYSSS